MNTIFKNFSDKIKNHTKLRNDILKYIFSQYPVQRFMITLIQDRIYETGFDSEGNKLKTDLSKFSQSGYYADYTILHKQFYKQRFENVTLNNTGTFYKSWVIKAYKDFYKIESKDKKDVSDNFLDMYNNRQNFENAILSLSEEESKELIEKIIIPKFIDEFRVNIAKIILDVKNK